MTKSLSTAWLVGEPDVVSCELAGGAALLDLRCSKYFSLNRVAAVLWEKLSQPIQFAALRDGIVEQFLVSPEECERDLTEILETFRDNGLIRFADAPPA